MKPTKEIEFISECMDTRDKMFNDIILYSYIIQKVATFLIGIAKVFYWLNWFSIDRWLLNPSSQFSDLESLIKKVL